MPELITTPEQQAQDRNSNKVGYSLPSIPASVYGFTDIEETEHESILHPIKIATDIIDAINILTAEVKLLLQQSIKNNTFQDTSIMVGATIGYTVRYLDYRYVYVYSPTNVTIAFNTGGSKAIVANTWTNISPIAGTIITINGGNDSVLQQLIFRACNTIEN